MSRSTVSRPTTIGMTDLSLADTYRARCPLCGTAFDATIWRIIDLDARPDRQPDIRDGSLQRSFCPACIGPGVERLGALCVVGTGPQGRQHINVAFEKKNAAEAIQTAHARFVKRCSDLGIDPAGIIPGGGGIARSIAELADSLAACSGIKVKSAGEERLHRSVELVFARDCEERRAILTAHPDLVRPGTIRLLASLPDTAPDIPRFRVRPILALLTAATREGIDAAIALCRADHEALAALRRLPGPVADAYLATLPETDEPSVEELEARGARILRFIAEHPDLHGDLKATVFLALGRGWQAQVPRHGDAAGERARSWLSRIIEDDDPAIRRLSRLEARQGLSASWDARLEGSAIENNRQALAHAEAAVAIAGTMSDEDQAGALMELGIGYTRRMVGDTFANRALAREAFARALLPGASHLTLQMVRYNEALTWIEESSGDIIEKIDTGLARLELLRTEGADLFRPDQQQLIHHSLGAALLRRGSLTDDVDDFGEAAQQFSIAYGLAVKQRDHRAKARLAYLHYAARTECMIRGGEPPDAGRVLAAIDTIQTDYDQQRAPAFFLETERLRALVLERFAPADGSRDAVLAARRRIVDTLRAHGMEQADWRDIFRLGVEQERSLDLASAARSFEAAAAAAETTLASASTSLRRDEEIVHASHIFSPLIAVLASLHERGEADGWRVLAAMEQGRARDLLDELGNRELPCPENVPDVLLATERELREALAGEPDDSVARMIGSEADIGRRVQQRQALYAQLGETYGRIAATGPAGAAYVALRRPAPPEAAALRILIDGLSDDTGVLAYWIDDPSTVAVFVRPHTPPLIRTLAFTPADARDLLEGLKARVDAPVPAQEQPPEAWQLYGQHLIEPFVGEIRHCRRLIIVPHGPAHRFPFHALQLTPGELLVDAVATQHIPSLAILRDLAPAAILPGRMTARVLCSAPGPKERQSFQAEALTVAAALGTQADLEATRETLLASAGDADILHLICHGRFDEEDPLAGELLLADGPVTVRELLALRLTASLVSLAACETGKIAAAKGDRLKGFAQALLLAGARTALLTLWSVWSEPTRFWMEQFYGALRDTETSTHPIASAHRVATLATRHRYPDPTCWAPFIVLGRTE
ncbi:CHAT domain-containing protein [Ancylobacter sp. 6x-1]|uniref:CHAT domain-containing protein n=1 Tax=Ancylobacter crimeensis TaxID=2579147 RepID=A0ABT0DFK1_9HYPH|nr:CHAT domain-containing protein [Ancylobacter crimeensis]MCK0198741.1 CHAT domain-containing protein [Ancylobacter crimeensis]